MPQPVITSPTSSPQNGLVSEWGRPAKLNERDILASPTFSYPQERRQHPTRIPGSQASVVINHKRPITSLATANELLYAGNKTGDALQFDVRSEKQLVSKIHPAELEAQDCTDPPRTTAVHLNTANQECAAAIAQFQNLSPTRASVHSPPGKGKRAAKFEDSEPTFVHANPDGSLYVATGSGRITHWRADGSELTLEAGRTITGMAVQHEPPCVMVLTRSPDQTTGVHLFQHGSDEEWKAGPHIKYQAAAGTSFTCIASSPGKLYCGSAHGGILCFDMHTQESSLWLGHEAAVLCLQFQSVLVSGSVDQTARLWSQAGECTHIFAGHSDDVTAVHFQNQLLLTGSDDHCIKAWSCEDSSCLAIFAPPCRAGVTALAVDRCMLYAGFKDGLLCAFNLSSPCSLECGEKFEFHKDSEKTYHENAQCPNRTSPCELGCGASMRASEHCGHLLVCPHRVVPCELSCGQHGIQAFELEEHMRCVCPNRMVCCPPCQQQMQANKLEHHRECLCPFRIVCCPLECGITELKAKEQEEHALTACPNRIVECALGCGVSDLRFKDLGMHQAGACPHRIVPCSHGCGSEHRWVDDQEHLADHCPYRVVPCPLGCPAEMLRLCDSTNHTQQECPNRVVPCELLCGTPGIRFVDRDTHQGLECPLRAVPCVLGCDDEHIKACEHAEHIQSSCPERTVTCQPCGGAYRAKSLPKHQECSCPERQVLCSTKALPHAAEDAASGCGAMIKFRLLEAHEAEECPERRVVCGLCEMVHVARELDEHMQRDCPQRIVPCALGCSASTITADEHELHVEQFCPHTIVQCLLECGVEGLQRQNAEVHATKCPFRPAECGLGCGVGSLVQCELEDHQKHHCPERQLFCVCGYACKACQLPGHKVSDCPWRLVECQWDGEHELRQCDKHTHEVAECPSRPANCQYKCGVVGLVASTVDKHKLEECPFRPVPCQHCTANQTCASLAVHESTCPERPVDCGLKCGKYLVARELEQHEAKCPFRTVPCPLSCGASMRFKDRAEHTTHVCPERRVICKLGCGEGDPMLIAQNTQSPMHCLSHHAHGFDGCKSSGRQLNVLLAKNEQEHYKVCPMSNILSPCKAR